ncbi:MAG TPA: hypothetical protein GX399_05910 [Xanthomonadaceae bacterium]|nr:hypothetical protein [Xanthomonadaceae bacterium]
MAGAFIELDDAEIRAALKKLLAKLGDLEPVFRALGESLLISHRARFERGVSPSGRAVAGSVARLPEAEKEKPR